MSEYLKKPLAAAFAPEFTPEVTPQLLYKELYKKCRKWQFMQVSFSKNELGRELGS